MDNHLDFFFIYNIEVLVFIVQTSPLMSVVTELLHTAHPWMKCKKVDVFYKSRKTAKQKNQTTNKHQTTPKTKKTSSKLSETVKLQACLLEGPVYIQSFLFAISAVMRQIYCLTYMSNSCDSGCWFAVLIGFAADSSLS